MIIHTFMNMTVPRPPPMPIAMVRLLPPCRSEPITSHEATRTTSTTMTATTRPSFMVPASTESR